MSFSTAAARPATTTPPVAASSAILAVERTSAAPSSGTVLHGRPPVAPSSNKVVPAVVISGVAAAVTVQPAAVSPLKEITNSPSRATPPHLRGKVADVATTGVVEVAKTVAPAEKKDEVIVPVPKAEAPVPKASTPPPAATPPVPTPSAASLEKMINRLAVVEKRMEELEQAEERRKYLGTDHANAPFNIVVHSGMFSYPTCTNEYGN